MLIPVKNEPIVERQGSRWEYCFDTETKERLYLHLNCDSTTDKEGYCIMCGSACPTIWSSNIYFGIKFNG